MKKCPFDQTISVQIRRKRAFRIPAVSKSAPKSIHSNVREVFRVQQSITGTSWACRTAACDAQCSTSSYSLLECILNIHHALVVIKSKNFNLHSDGHPLRA